MILTGRDNKPIVIDERHVVAITTASSVINETIKASSCVHCIGHSFFVMETIEQVYLALYGTPIPSPAPNVLPSTSDIRTPTRRLIPRSKP